MGDSHVVPMIEEIKIVTAWDKNFSYEANEKRIKKEGGCKYYSFLKYEEGAYTTSMSAAHGYAYNINTELIIDGEKLNSPHTTVFPWMGYNDIISMDKYPNLENTVSVYIKKVLSKFYKSKVIFVYPIKNIVINSNLDHLENYKKYCNMLKNKCLDMGLNEPIDIYDVIKDVFYKQF